MARIKYLHWTLLPHPTVLLFQAVSTSAGSYTFPQTSVVLYNLNRPKFNFSMFSCLVSVCVCSCHNLLIWTCSCPHLSFTFNRIPSALSGPPGTSRCLLGASSSCLSPNGEAPGLLAEFRRRGGTMLSGSLFPVEHPSTAALDLRRERGGSSGWEGGSALWTCSVKTISDLWYPEKNNKHDVCGMTDV